MDGEEQRVSSRYFWGTERCGGGQRVGLLKCFSARLSGKSHRLKVLYCADILLSRGWRSLSVITNSKHRFLLGYPEWDQFIPHGGSTHRIRSEVTLHPNNINNKHIRSCQKRLGPLRPQQSATGAGSWTDWSESDQCKVNQHKCSFFLLRKGLKRNSNANMHVTKWKGSM